MLLVHSGIAKRRTNPNVGLPFPFFEYQHLTETLDSWFHFLCKNIPVVEIGGVKQIENGNRTRTEKDLSQANFSWVRSAYCLKTKSRSPTKSEVTLIAFGGGARLWEKFDELSSNTSWQDVLEDPYCLYDVVFECLYAQIDRLAWDLAHVYGEEEMVGSLCPVVALVIDADYVFKKILRSADHPGSASDKLDFVGLHMLSKHEIYLLEATEAIMTTLDSLRAHHEHVAKESVLSSSATSDIQASLRYRKTLFKSTDLRLKSLEKRTQNMINLVR